MVIRQKLFEEAKELFGFDFEITERLQNPGHVYDQKSVSDMISYSNKAIEHKKFELSLYMDRVFKFNQDLQNAFTAGLLK
jgi:hypothetical protein